MVDDFLLQRQCQTCLTSFPTNQALRSHLEVYRVGEQNLTLEIGRCRAHIAPVYDINKLCENCQLHATLTIVNHESDDGEKSEQDQISDHTRLRSRSVRRCPYDGCEKQFKARKELLKHFELHVDCNEVCVECFRRYTHVSAFIKHAKTHKYTSDRKRQYMLGLCDDLRDQAISHFDHMIGKLESSSNDTAMNPPKRMLDASGAEYNAPKRAMITCDNMEDMLGITSSEAQHGIPQLFEEGPVFDTVDLFAPPLFSHYPQPPVDNFDPPFFTSSLMDHIAQGDIDSMPDNTTELFLNADLASHERVDQWAQREYP